MGERETTSPRRAVGTVDLGGCERALVDEVPMA